MLQDLALALTLTSRSWRLSGDHFFPYPSTPQSLPSRRKPPAYATGRPHLCLFVCICGYHLSLFDSSSPCFLTGPCFRADPCFLAGFHSLAIQPRHPPPSRRFFMPIQSHPRKPAGRFPRHSLIRCAASAQRSSFVASSPPPCLHRTRGKSIYGRVLQWLGRPISPIRHLVWQPPCAEWILFKPRRVAPPPPAGRFLTPLTKGLILTHIFIADPGVDAKSCTLG